MECIRKCQYDDIKFQSGSNILDRAIYLFIEHGYTTPV